MERDCFTFAHFYIFLVISTHALTWSATSTGNTHYEYFKISTHALTWSATCTNKRRSGLSAFQLTRSRGARPLSDAVAKYKGVIFQLTRSRGARHRQPARCRTARRISTHALTWSATWALQLVRKLDLFQLTRSRGARLSVDEVKELIKSISTHALTWSATGGGKK